MTEQSIQYDTIHPMPAPAVKRLQPPKPSAKLAPRVETFLALLVEIARTASTD